jgi:predicted kinase
MEAVLFTGIQASGKSSFYVERFLRTHVRISLDLVRTRARERALLSTCLATRQRFVVDNTNASAMERAAYIAAAKSASFRVLGFYFESRIEAALARNRGRSQADRVPDKGVLGTYGRLQVPRRSEGFDGLFFVRLSDVGFVVEEFRDEV